MKFLIYSRKSVFTGRGESIENQVELCRRYILTNYPGSTDGDITVYEDEGFSGKTLDRPQFQRMLRDMRAQRPDCLVCYRLDRISRSVGDFAALIEELNSRGVAFVCIREKFDTSTPMGKAMLYIASVFAQLERETIAERVRDNMLLLARTGRWLGGATPTGYTSEKTREVVIDGKVKSACALKTDPDEIGTVDLIYRKFLELQSLNGVRKYLHGHGLRSRQGQDFSLPGLREILQNPVYCAADRDSLAYFREKRADVCFTEQDCGHGRGLLSYNKRDYAVSRAPRNGVDKWIVAVGRHEGRVSGRDWVAVQRILERGGPDTPHSNARNGYALLSGLIVCARCGRRMFSKARSGRPGQYDYICQNKLQLGKGTCACPNLHGPQADELVCRALEPHAKPDGGLIPLLKELRRALQAEHAPDPPADLRQRVKAREQELERLVLALGSAAPGSAFAQKIAQRAEEVESELNRLQAGLVQTGAEEEPPSARAPAPPVLSIEDSSMTVPEKRALIRLLVQKCQWDGETLHIFLCGGQPSSQSGEVSLSMEADSPP